MVLVARHSIADGLSLAYVIRDLLRLLSEETLAPLPVAASHEALLGLEEDAGTGESRGESFGKIASLSPRFQELAPRVESLRITPELAGKLQKFARQEQTSIHGALASSVVFAVRKLVKGGASTQRAGVVLKRCSEPTSSRRYCMAYALRNRE